MTSKLARGDEAVFHSIAGMKSMSTMVSIHPYFKIRGEYLDAMKASLPAFVKKTEAEPKNLFYAFTLDGDELFCREAYADAEGVLAHLRNVQTLLDELLSNADLVRFEVHGPAAELEKLEGPLVEMKPRWFIQQCGIDKAGL